MIVLFPQFIISPPNRLLSPAFNLFLNFNPFLPNKPQFFQKQIILLKTPRFSFDIGLQDYFPMFFDSFRGSENFKRIRILTIKLFGDQIPVIISPITTSYEKYLLDEGTQENFFLFSPIFLHTRLRFSKGHPFNHQEIWIESWNHLAKILPVFFFLNHCIFLQN